MSIGGGIKPYSDVVLQDNPWLYWRLEETSGTFLADSSGNGRNGTADDAVVRGVAGQSGRTGFGSSVVTGASYQRLFGINAGTDLYAGVSIECFIKPNTLSGGRQCLGYMGSQTNRPGHFMYLTGSTISLEQHENYASIYTMAQTGTIASTAWHHIVGVYTKPQQSGNYPLNGQIYINGVSVASGLVKEYEIGLGTNWNRQGCGNSIDVDSQFDGSIDEFAIYLSALSTARIAAHYAAK